MFFVRLWSVINVFNYNFGNDIVICSLLCLVGLVIMWLWCNLIVVFVMDKFKFMFFDLCFLVRVVL